MLAFFSDTTSFNLLETLYFLINNVAKKVIPAAIATIQIYIYYKHLNRQINTLYIPIK